MHGNFGSAQSDAVAERVREELARRRVSRQWLADQARISISTLEKALAGSRPFTLSTVLRIEDALKTTVRPTLKIVKEKAPAGGLAPEELGAYSRPSVKWLEGDYLTLRPSFSEETAICAYKTSVEWDDDDCLLRFKESSRADSDFSQRGLVSFPHFSGHIYLVTNQGGQYRLILLSRPTIHGEMNGVLTTLYVGPGSHLTPTSTPITLAKKIDWEGAELGVIRPGMKCYDDYKHRLDQITTDRFAVFPH